MAKKFISFLGTTDYAAVFYELNGIKTETKVKFVQQALIQLICTNFDIEKDKVIILLTDKARATNWEKLK